MSRDEGNLGTREAERRTKVGGSEERTAEMYFARDLKVERAVPR